MQQLKNRNASFPVPWRDEERYVPWLVPGRLLLTFDTGTRGEGGASRGVSHSRPPRGFSAVCAVVTHNGVLLALQDAR